MKKALILEFENYDELAQQVAAIMLGFNNAMERGGSLAKDPVKTDNENVEVDGGMLEILLLKKGYKCKSAKAKVDWCKKLYIRSARRGSKLKYMLSDIERVPARITTSLVVKEARKVQP